MNLVRYTPNSLANAAFSRFFDDFLPHESAEYGAGEGFLPKVDIRDEKEEIVLSAELPGVSKEDIKVQVESRLLTLSGEKKHEETSEENGFYRSERSYGAFKRSFQLPEIVESEKIHAEFRNGLMTLRLPKKPEAAPREIAINGDAEAPREIGVND